MLFNQSGQDSGVGAHVVVWAALGVLRAQLTDSLPRSVRPLCDGDLFVETRLSEVVVDKSLTASCLGCVGIQRTRDVLDSRAHIKRFCNYRLHLLHRGARFAGRARMPPLHHAVALDAMPALLEHLPELILPLRMLLLLVVAYDTLCVDQFSGHFQIEPGNVDHVPAALGIAAQDPRLLGVEGPARGGAAGSFAPTAVDPARVLASINPLTVADVDDALGQGIVFVDEGNLLVEAESRPRTHVDTVSNIRRHMRHPEGGGAVRVQDGLGPDKFLHMHRVVVTILQPAGLGHRVQLQSLVHLL